MTILFALMAALANALNVMTQHIASTSRAAPSRGARLVRYLVHNPMWLVGWVALLAAFVFQALALHHGLLSVVQTLLVTELVFGLVLRRLWIRQRIRPLAWAAAALICAGIGVFLAVAEPRGGHPVPTSGAWASSIAACAAVVALGCLLGWRGHPAWRAGCFATAAAVTWALEATFIKSLTDVLASAGVGAAFTRWPLYAVAVGGVAGTLLVQAALHVGPLRVSQPLLVLVDPVVSIALSVHLFDEYFTTDTVHLAVGSVAFLALGAGLITLTRSLPDELGPAPAAAGDPTGQPAGA